MVTVVDDIVLRNLDKQHCGVQGILGKMSRTDISVAAPAQLYQYDALV
jgi:hypothetical protein